MNALLSLYANMINSLKVGNYNGIISLSKPLFLLAIFELIEERRITENKIKYNDAFLSRRFRSLYERYNPHKFVFSTSTFIKPFYHLGTSDFYHLVWSEGMVHTKGNSITPSAKYLREHLLYAEFDEELWTLLQEKESRDFLKQSIVEYYLTPSTI